MKKLIAVALFTLSYQLCDAQTWTGSPSVQTGQSVDYTFTNGTFYSSYNFPNPANGTVTAQSQNGLIYKCTVSWLTAGTSTLSFTGGSIQRGTLSVLVSCPTLVTPTATFAYPNGTSICGSGSITYTGAPPTGVTWYWQTSSTGTSTSNSSASFPVSASGTYYLRANCGSTWGTAKATSAITIKTIPVVTASTTATCSGANGGVIFTNNLASTTDTWTSTSSNVTGNSNSSGVSASSSPYNFTLNETLTNTSNVNGTVTYTVTPSNNGCTGSPVQITTTVYPLPSVSFGSSSQNICSGGTAAASLTTNGVSGTTYTWSYSGHSAISGASAPASNATSFSQSLTSIASIPVTGTYQVSASANGCYSLTQPSISFNVNPLPTINLTNSSPSLCSGSSTNISFSSSVSATTFTWSLSPTNVLGALAQGTAVSAGTVIQPLTSQDGFNSGSVIYSFQSQASFANGGSCSSTGSATVSVKPVPTINSISTSPASKVICSGAQTSLTMNTNGVSGTTYAWTVTPAANVYGSSTPGSVTSTTQTLSNVSASTGSVSYSIVPTANGCQGITASVSVAVNPIPTISFNNISPTICSGANTNIAFSSGVAGTTFIWGISATNATGAAVQASWTSAGTISQQLSSQDGLTPGSVSYNLSSSASFANGGTCSSSGSTSVTVNPKPVATALSKTYFTGTAINVSLTSSIGGSTYSYSVASATNISGSSSGSTTPITQPLAITDGINPASVTYSVTPTAFGCSGTPANTIVSIFPQPVLASSSPSVYMGSSTTLSAQGFYDSYTWNATTGPISGGSSISVSKADTYTLSVVKNGVTSGGTSITILGQFTSQNLTYIISNSLQIATSDTTRIKWMPVDSVQQAIHYFDGHGRLIQSISTQSSPLKNDLVQAVAYDDFGRKSKNYLPFTSSNNGLYKSDPLGIISGNYTTSTQYQFYNNGTTDRIVDDTYPYSETQFESSELNKPAQDYGPGAAWRNGSNPKTVSHQFLVNQLNEVINFTYDATTGLVSAGNGPAAYYASGLLAVKKTMDEQQHEVIEYTDKLGHTICKKVQSGGTDAQANKLYASTYYIYDDLGNLVVVLPPEATKRF